VVVNNLANCYSLNSKASVAIIFQRRSLVLFIGEIFFLRLSALRLQASSENPFPPLSEIFYQEWFL